MRIAIIGGIGSGKSVVLRVAEEMGLSVLNADLINAELLENAEYISQIAEAFRDSVVDGKIDRKKLAEIVFSNDEARKHLNAIAHPRILKRIAEDNSNLLVVEMPLLVEIGAEKMFDEIVLVSTPIDLRFERLKARGVSKEEAERRINAQASETSLKSVATRVVDNSGNIDALKAKAKSLFEAILAENGF